MPLLFAGTNEEYVVKIYDQHNSGKDKRKYYNKCKEIELDKWNNNVTNI